MPNPSSLRLQALIQTINQTQNAHYLRRDVRVLLEAIDPEASQTPEVQAYIEALAPWVERLIQSERDHCRRSLQSESKPKWQRGVIY